MIRSHEMLRHTPTLSMLFDLNGDIIQVVNPSSINVVDCAMNFPNIRRITSVRTPTTTGRAGHFATE
jgi:hypothetical protein